MTTVWKFPFRVSRAPFTIKMPAGATILAVDFQNVVGPCVWAMCDPDAEREIRHFRIYGTGWEIADNPGRHVGTFQVEGGLYVWHLFELDYHVGANAGVDQENASL